MKRATLAGLVALLTTSADAQQPIQGSVVVHRTESDGSASVRTYAVFPGRVVAFAPGVQPWQCEADLGDALIAREERRADRPLPDAEGVDLVVRCWASPEHRQANVVVVAEARCGGALMAESLELHGARTWSLVTARCGN